MKETYKVLLSELLSERLISNWNKCDMLSTEVMLREALTEECNTIHEMIREYDIPVEEIIQSRF